MKIHGWIAINKHGLILGSFRESKADAGAAARQILRLAGGLWLVSGFRLIRATLTIQDIDGDIQRQETEVEE
jgi:hypothetical protein